MKTLNCEICKKEFNLETKRYNQAVKRRQKAFCCSEKCWQEYRNLIKNETANCPHCNKEFIRRKTIARKQKFCSQKCACIESQKHIDPNKTSISLKKYYASEEGKKFLKAKVKKLTKSKYCKICNKIFYKSKQKYCSLKCLNESRINWAENISKTRKELFKNGHIDVTGGNTKWLNYKNIRVQGSYEFRACIILDSLLEKSLISDED